ncbi:hypothetical protein MF271_19735 (plasmid) [Deinococcus sp. KNUC1210]|uniref:hypothetical protein n=1 Tax=Deinococcus sp. KNUC1210 TaxID=2917691 RepID=UPI001EF07065|nr:hypothetical protein [Deinococcus sp. KNUC1210]ULH17647.1 hypothetical protein MF271_19735 [Deinococcus sp. KNUC1210]
MQPLFASKVGRAGALLALALAGSSWAAAPLPSWEQVFGDMRPAVHLSATYPDRQGKPQVLEFWRDASGRVVRRTGQRAELRLTPAGDGEDVYQLRNLVNRTAFDVHRVNLVRVGIFTDRWSVQHLLDRPAGAYTLVDLKRQTKTAAGECVWWRVKLASGKATEVCWSSTLGLPLQLVSAGRTVMKVNSVQPLKGLPSATLPAGWQEYNADEDLAPD